MALRSRLRDFARYQHVTRSLQVLMLLLVGTRKTLTLPDKTSNLLLIAQCCYRLLNLQFYQC